jgi:hypothetical protein
MSHKYKMTISRQTVDKLGVKLYDKVSIVIAELVANSYDADATNVEIKAPMSAYLATKTGTATRDLGFEIVVKDNGIGMHPDIIDDFYLKVGAERRDDPNRGDTSPKFHRKVMGRKGIGKLAPFGICQKIEVISSGGERTRGKDVEGKDAEGFITAHLILDRANIIQETDKAYYPDVGTLDGTVSKSRGTIIKLKEFDKRLVPTIDQFERQLAQRFGIKSDDWKIVLYDATKTEADPEYRREVGEFTVPTMNDTMIKFEGPKEKESIGDPEKYKVIGSDGNEMDDLRAGFEDDEGNFYGVTGWMAYSKNPYKDDLMAGVRIYCRGKIASQTALFGRKAGFEGEYDIRSYLVGELNADWLDDTEDLIETNRRDILWSHELGQKFQEWGQEVVLKIGKLSRNPFRKKVWELFKEIGKVEERINAAFPLQEHDAIKENAWDILEHIGKKMRREELDVPGEVETLVDVGIMMAPHLTLDRSLREAADEATTPLEFVLSLLKTARVAELSSFGRIAEDRVRMIEKLNSLREDPKAKESDLQELLKQAPWLINPQWVPLTSNEQFSTLKNEFERYYKKRTGDDIKLNDFSDPDKRPDFVLSSEGNTLQLVEIKRPDHVLKNEEMDRIVNYMDIMRDFLNEDTHKEFRKYFDKHHLTLVCEGEKLSGAQKAAFVGYRERNMLTWIDWSTFLLRTAAAHQAFLKEAERQKKYGYD